MREKLNLIRRSVVFLGEWKTEIENEMPVLKPDFSGTGYLTSIKGIPHLITAKHVIYDMDENKFDDEQMHVFFNKKDGTLTSRPIREIKDQLSVDWAFHPTNQNVDVAILPFIWYDKTEDCAFVDENYSMDIGKLHELIDVFYLSYQPGLEVHNKVAPVFRSGTISLINDDGPFIIDGAAFEGNSGSPVFLQWEPMPASLPMYSESKTISRKFIGILGAYLHCGVHNNHTGFPDSKFHENTGLSDVWPLKYIEAIKNSKPFQDQLFRITMLFS